MLPPAAGVRRVPHTLPFHDNNFPKQNVISPWGGLALLCVKFFKGEKIWKTNKRGGKRQLLRSSFSLALRGRDAHLHAP